MKSKGVCSLDEKYDQPRQHIKKLRHYVANKVLSNQSYGFSGSRVWMWQLDYKESEHWRTDAFELWNWRQLLRVPWTARRSNPSILMDISSKYSLEGLMLKRKLQYFGHLMQWMESLEKSLMLGKIEGRRRRGQQRVRWLGASPTQWTWVWVNSGSWWWICRPGVLQSIGSQRIGQDWATELNWLSEQGALCRMAQGWRDLRIWRRTAGVELRKQEITH